tara:strand:- start:861 stop:1889 length:1029 start_codon:yes stop_codon:yes gene_type:complete
MDITVIANKIGAEIYTPQGATREFVVQGVKPLDLAGPDEISFVLNDKYRQQMKSSKAGAFLLANPNPLVSKLQLIHREPYAALASIAQMFYQSKKEFEGVSQLAFIGENAQLGKGVTLFPFSYVGPGAKVGDNSTVYSFSYIGKDAVVGNNCTLYPSSVLLEECEIGDNTILQGGAVVGGDGFGFAPSKTGIRKVPQQGKVVIEEDVEVGACTTIDRATFDVTRIGKGSKIDAHVHVAHNVKLGAHSILCGMVGISGSCNIGENFIAAGQAGITQGLNIAPKVTLAAKTAVTKDITDSGTYGGMPAKPIKQWAKESIGTKKIPDLLKRIAALEAKFEKLNSN